MSFKRRDAKKVDKADLNVRLVVDDDLDSIGQSLSDMTSASAAAAASRTHQSSSSSPPVVGVAAVASSIPVFSSHSLARALGPSSTSSFSVNNPHQSSLASGHRDMELVELGGGGGSDRERNDSFEEKRSFGSGSGGGKKKRDSTSPSSSSSHPRTVDDDGDDEDDHVSDRVPIDENGTAPRPARIWPSVLRDGWRAYFARSFHEFFLTSKMNVLLVAVPLAILCQLAHFGDGPVFVFALIGLCPLAERISFVTDEMAAYTNDTVGGLLSATMGNATELIVSIFALISGQLRIIQLSLLGSVLSNLLLVQGTAFLVGGLKHSQQKFSQAAAKTNVSLLLLAVMALTFPMILIAANGFAATTAAELRIYDATTGALLFNGTGTTTGEDAFGLQEEGISADDALALSRFTSILLLIVYGLLIFYQLKTHAHLFESREEPPAAAAPAAPSASSSSGDEDSSASHEEESGGDAEPPVLGPHGSIVWAILVTIFISVLSELIVSAIDGAAKSIGIPVLFSATILLPIVGNAAEHFSAIIFARKNQMDIALGISVGSSTQISLFVVPFLVILAWMAGQPLSLDFQAFETVSLLLTVLISSIVLSTGKSDWLYGTLMIVAYCIIAAAFWLQKQPQNLE